jgi:hypothetical protein
MLQITFGIEAWQAYSSGNGTLVSGIFLTKNTTRQLNVIIQPGTEKCLNQPPFASD